MNRFKSCLVAAAVAGAFAAPAASQAASAIYFDQTGSGSLANAVILTQFTYKAGNALFDNVVQGGTVPLVSSSTAVSGDVASQAIASNVGTGNPGCVGAQCTYTFTYVFNVPVTGTQNLTNSGALNQLSLGQNGLGTFEMYANVPGSVNETSGAGYAGGILILSGAAAVDPAINMSLIQTTASPTPFGAATGYTPLGVIGGANRVTPTVGLVGSTSLVIDVSFANSDFFLSDVESLVLDLSLGSGTADTADMTHPQGFTAPFDANNPVNATVDGITPDYGTNARNDFYCTSGGSVDCDVQVGTTSNTFFNHSVPEPGSLALLGLALGFAGIGIRRRPKS